MQERYSVSTKEREITIIYILLIPTTVYQIATKIVIAVHWKDTMLCANWSYMYSGLQNELCTSRKLSNINYLQRLILYCTLNLCW